MNQAYGNTRLARGLVWLAAFVNVALLFMLCSLASMGAAWMLALLLMLLVDGPVALYAYNQGLFFEWRVKRTFQPVCAGLGGNFVGEKNDYLASARAGMQSRGQYYVATQKKVAYPELKNIRGNGEAWTAEVRFFDGQTIDDYNKHADAFALAFSVPFVTFDLAENGLISVRAGSVPVPAAYNHPGQLQTLPAAPNVRAVPQIAPVVPNVYTHAQVAPDLTY